MLALGCRGHQMRRVTTNASKVSVEAKCGPCEKAFKKTHTRGPEETQNAKCVEKFPFIQPLQETSRNGRHIQKRAFTSNLSLLLSHPLIALLHIINMVRSLASYSPRRVVDTHSSLSSLLVVCFNSGQEERSKAWCQQERQAWAHRGTKARNQRGLRLVRYRWIW